MFHNKQHPIEMDAPEIGQYMTHLAVKENVVASTQNQALCAIVFLYKHLLKTDIGDLGDIVWAKKPNRLPVVFTWKEIKAVLDQLSGVKWIMANLLYGSGLRLIECLHLRVKDIDFEYNHDLHTCDENEKFGEDLICGRYRFDKANNRKLKTVEIIVEQSAWQKKSQRIPRNKVIPIQVNYDEIYLRRLVKSTGGRWNQMKKVWELPYGEIVNLGLEQRIVKED